MSNRFPFECRVDSPSYTVHPATSGVVPTVQVRPLGPVLSGVLLDWFFFSAHLDRLIIMKHIR